MRQDEETRPILTKDSYRGTSTFDLDDPRQSLNGVADDFAELSQGKGTEKSDHDSPILLEPGVAALSVGLLLVSVAAMIGMPTWVAGLVTHSSDPFAMCFILPTFALLITLTIVVIMRRAVRGTAHEISLYPFFMRRTALYGLLTSVGLVLQAFCGVPSHTPAYVQAISFIAAIPAACITKFVITRKAFTCRQVTCILLTMTSIVLVIGNLLAHANYVPGSVPMTRGRNFPETHLLSVVTNERILNSTTVLPGENSTFSSSTPAPTTANPLDEFTSATTRILWSLGFSLGWVLYGMAIVLLDDPIRVKGGNPMVVCLYGHLMTFLWILFMFFVDLLPKFGWAVYLSDFRYHLHHGIKCLFGADSDCAVIACRGWLEILIYTGFFIAQFYLMAVAECPIYTLLVTGAAVPLVALTWLCFADTGLDFLWYPSITPLATVIFIALFIAIPAAILYRYYTKREQMEKFEEL